LISDHHSAYPQMLRPYYSKCEELLTETRDNEWNYKFTGNLYKGYSKCRIVVDQDFVEQDFIKKKKQSSLSLPPSVNALMISKFEIAY
jgi:hypothetical protein